MKTVGTKILGIVLLLIIIFIALCIVTGNYNVKNGLFVNENSAIQIYENVLHKEYELKEADFQTYKPYNIKFVLCVWIIKITPPVNYRGSSYKVCILAIGGVVLWLKFEK